MTKNNFYFRVMMTMHIVINNYFKGDDGFGSAWQFDGERASNHCNEFYRALLCCNPLKNTVFHRAVFSLKKTVFCCVVFLSAPCFTVMYSNMHEEQCTEICSIIVSQLCAPCNTCNKLHCTELYCSLHSALVYFTALCFVF